MNNRLAYFDSFAGLVPCKVIAANIDPLGIAMVTTRITATRGAYKRGDIVTTHARHVWPRDVSTPKRGTYGQTYIVGPYSWQERCAA